MTRLLSDLIGARSDSKSVLPHVAKTNTFNVVADKAFPGIGRFREKLLDAVGDHVNVSLSGAGPSLYAVLPAREAAESVAAALAQQGLTPIVAGMAEKPLIVLEK